MLVSSTMMPLGTIAPAFELLNPATGERDSLASLKSDQATVVMFICNHCPYVKHIKPALIDVINRYIEQGVSFIAISSNDAEEYPADSPENMIEEGYPCPYLYDQSQAVAKSYQAACTPDFYLFDGDLMCVYRGRFDAATPGNGEPVTGADLTEAIDTLLAGEGLSHDQSPSMGCNIKWIDPEDKALSDRADMRDQ